MPVCPAFAYLYPYRCSRRTVAVPLAIWMVGQLCVVTVGVAFGTILHFTPGTESIAAFEKISVFADADELPLI